MDRIVSASIGLLFVFAVLAPTMLSISPTGGVLARAETRVTESATPDETASLYALGLPLETADGATTNLAALAGKPRIATMFYAHCESMCPIAIQTLQALDSRLTAAEREALGFVLLSLDPVRDSPQMLRERAQAQGLQESRWVLARTSLADLATAAEFLGIRQRPLANGEVDHSSALVLLDGEGRELSRSSVMGAVDAQFLADIRATLHGVADR